MKNLKNQFLYLTSDYDSLCREQGYPGYAVYYKRRTDKVEEEDVANINTFVQLLEIDSKLGSANEDQLAGLLICPFPNLEMINVTFNDVMSFFTIVLGHSSPKPSSRECQWIRSLLFGKKS